MLKAIATIMRELCSHDHLYFDTPLKVKRAPNAPALHFWAASVSPAGDVYVMDADQEWHQVEQREQDAQVMESLFHRVRFLKQQLQTKQQEAAL